MTGVAAAGLAAAAVGISVVWPLLLADVNNEARHPALAIGGITACGYLGMVAGPPLVGLLSALLRAAGRAARARRHRPAGRDRPRARRSRCSRAGNLTDLVGSVGRCRRATRRCRTRAAATGSARRASPPAPRSPRALRRPRAAPGFRRGLGCRLRVDSARDRDDFGFGIGDRAQPGQFDRGAGRAPPARPRDRRAAVTARRRRGFRRGVRRRREFAVQLPPAGQHQARGVPGAEVAFGAHRVVVELDEPRLALGRLEAQCRRGRSAATGPGAEAPMVRAVPLGPVRSRAGGHGRGRSFVLAPGRMSTHRRPVPAGPSSMARARTPRLQTHGEFGGIQTAPAFWKARESMGLCASRAASSCSAARARAPRRSSRCQPCGGVSPRT